MFRLKLNDGLTMCKVQLNFEQFYDFTKFYTELPGKLFLKSIIL